MTILVQLFLFLSSYSPLLGVFALLDTFGSGWPSLVCAIVAAVGVAATPLLILVDRSTEPQELEVRTASPRDGDVLAYIATYLVPFASVELHTVRQELAIAVFMLLIATLYVRTQMFYINPLLAVAGYRVFQAETAAGGSIILLSRLRFVRPSSTVRAVRLSGYVWRERR